MKKDACGSCGGIKEGKASRCQACRYAQQASQKLARLQVPDTCGCSTPVPSPWHCFCARWKPAAADFCEVCTR